MALDLNCDWRAGFVMDPNKKQRVGYLMAFEGLDMGEFLKPDIEVFTPFNSNESPGYGEVKFEGDDKKITCVGMIENFSFGGGVGDPLCISAYISSENANILQAKLKTTLSTNKVTKFAWWICNFDEENKAWFEEAYPKAPTTVVGQVNAPGGKDFRIQVAQEATKIHSTLDSNVYNLYLEVIPAANSTYNFHFATSTKTPYIRNWGLKVGNNAASATS
ncbi:hypothetical protein [Cystobacter ferrugineus]|uniref:Uncharacterized protein n=1 Tax=Cystobacter ferrugineus TaxID=83449 RepID=A0A1L9BDH3_9BACT|nr:hypothetical protein [Cystobacter ferrugineus]OJH40283.1 hypothetical protein BON30_14680 [Cystobacter ferrugineus]